MEATKEETIDGDVAVVDDDVDVVVPAAAAAAPMAVEETTL